jgi:hypothetical protein
MTEPSISQKLKRLGGPLDILRAGIRAVPAVKYALGVAGVAAALAIATSLFSSVSAALVGIAVMLPLMVLLVIFAAITGLARTDTRIPALVFTWAVLVLFVGSAALLAGAVFFDWPKSINTLIASIVSSREQGSTTASNSSNREAEARRMYEHALAVRKGRGAAGLKESMEIFRRIGQEYSETSAARDALEQLRASEEVAQKLDDLRDKLRDAVKGNESAQAEGSKACPESVTYDLCRKLQDQEIETTVKMQGILGRCSLEEAAAILKECSEMVGRREGSAASPEPSRNASANPVASGSITLVQVTDVTGSSYVLGEPEVAYPSGFGPSRLKGIKVRRGTTEAFLGWAQMRSLAFTGRKEKNAKGTEVWRYDVRVELPDGAVTVVSLADDWNMAYMGGGGTGLLFGKTELGDSAVKFSEIREVKILKAKQ